MPSGPTRASAPATNHQPHVVRQTIEVLNTDAEGLLVLATVDCVRAQEKRSKSPRFTSSKSLATLTGGHPGSRWEGVNAWLFQQTTTAPCRRLVGGTG